MSSADPVPAAVPAPSSTAPALSATTSATSGPSATSSTVSSVPLPAPTTQSLRQQADAMQRQMLESLANQDAGVGGALVREIPPVELSGAETVKFSAGGVTLVSTSVNAHVENVGRTAAALGPRMRACYNDARVIDPGATGTVVLAASLGVDGAVIAARVTRNEGLPTKGTDCMRSVLAKSTFRAPSGPNAGGANVMMTWRFVAPE